MKRFEVGTYKTFCGEIEMVYNIEKVSAKSVIVTIFKGKRNEKTKRCKLVDNGNSQYCEFKGMVLESDDERVA